MTKQSSSPCLCQAVDKVPARSLKATSTRDSKGQGPGLLTCDSLAQKGDVFLSDSRSQRPYMVRHFVFSMNWARAIKGSNKVGES